MGPYRYVFEIFKGHEGAIAEEPVVGASEPVPVQHRASPGSVQNYLVHLRGYSGERGIGGLPIGGHPPEGLYLKGWQ